MLSLKRPLDETIRVNGKEYQWDMSFDNVLRWYDLIDDKGLQDVEKILIAFEMFVPDCQADIQTQIDTVQAISKYIADAPDEQVSGDQEQYYSFAKDAEYIFASFYAEYGIDLINEQGKLRWEKFIALFRGMSDHAKINKIIGIRAAPLPTGNSEMEMAERNRLVELKSIYTLDTDRNQQMQDTQMDKMFDSLVNMAKKGG